MEKKGEIPVIAEDSLTMAGDRESLPYLAMVEQQKRCLSGNHEVDHGNLYGQLTRAGQPLDMCRWCRCLFVPKP